MKKNLLSIAVISAIILTTLAGCGKDKTSTENTTTTNVETETDKSTEVDLCSDNVNITGNLGGAVSVEVKTVDEAATEYKAVEEYLKDTNSVFEMYDIKISDKNGNDIKLSNSVKVSIKISEKLAQASGDAYVIFYSEDDSFTKIAASEENGVVSFMTSHFSIYTVVKYDSKNETAVEKIEAVTVADMGTEEAGWAAMKTSDIDSCVEDMDKTMLVTKAVDVRSGPNSMFVKLGTFAVGETVKVIGQYQENGWYKIEYAGSVGYVLDTSLEETNSETITDQTTSGTEQTTTEVLTEPATQPTQPTTQPTQPTTEQPTTEVPTEPSTEPTTEPQPDPNDHSNEDFPYELYKWTTYDGHFGFFYSGDDNLVNLSKCIGALQPKTEDYIFLGQYKNGQIIFIYNDSMDRDKCNKNLHDQGWDDLIN